MPIPSTLATRLRDPVVFHATSEITEGVKTDPMYTNRLSMTEGLSDSLLDLGVTQVHVTKITREMQEIENSDTQRKEHNSQVKLDN